MEKRFTTEEAGNQISPPRTAQTVRLWCKNEGLEHSRDGMTGQIMISRFALKKFCKRKGIEMGGDE